MDRSVLHHFLLNGLAILVLAFSTAKVIQHYFSVWRTGPLDYVLGIAGIACSILVLHSFGTSTRSRIAMVGVAVVALSVSLWKIYQDFRDFSDLLLCASIMLTAITLLAAQREIEKIFRAHV